MRKAIKITEYLWLFVAGASLYEIFRLWGNVEAAKMYYLTLPVGIFMFFFRRRFRKKMEKRQEEKLKNQE